MKLLVGGDSFAVFPDHCFNYKEDREYVDYPSSPKGEGFRQYLNFQHWCQKLDSKATSVGINSGDISTTTFITLQELIDNNYTHCIFFVTNFYRDNLQIEKQHTIDSADFAQNTNFDSVYKDKNFMPNREHKFIRNSIWYETDEIIGPHKAGIMQYLRYNADFKYIHDRLSNLMFLKKYCDDNNINICFVLPFYPQEFAKGVIQYIPAKHFTYEINRDTEFFKWAVTHHTEQEHKDIAHLFQTEYKEWLNK
jgi:hypothetical protein